MKRRNWNYVHVKKNNLTKKDNEEQFQTNTDFFLCWLGNIWKKSECFFEEVEPATFRVLLRILFYCAVGDECHRSQVIVLPMQKVS